MIEFHSFETFDPNGPGLGNLFGQVSPFEALGIWPSGDFRLAPGDGAVPAFGYYLGAAFAAILLALRARPLLAPARVALVSGLLAVAARLRVARVGGTPYTAAKAIVIAAPVAARGHPRAAAAPPGRRPLPARGRRLLAARLRQRPGRADLLLARPDRAAPAGRRRTRPWCSPRRSCSTRNRASATSPGSCAAAASASRAEGDSRRPRPPPGVALRRHRRRRPARAAASPACACAAAPPLLLWERRGPVRRPEPLPADRRPPGAPGPRPLTSLSATFHAHRADNSPISARARRAAGSMARHGGRRRRSPSSCPTASRWSCPRARAAPTPRRRSAPAWPRRRWRSASTASCATWRRRSPTAPRSRSSPTATPRRSS